MKVEGITEGFTAYIDNEKGIIISLRPINYHPINLFWSGKVKSCSYEKAEKIDVEKVLIGIISRNGDRENAFCSLSEKGVCIIISRNGKTLEKLFIPGSPIEIKLLFCPLNRNHNHI